MKHLGTSCNTCWWDLLSVCSFWYAQRTAEEIWQPRNLTCLPLLYVYCKRYGFLGRQQLRSSPGLHKGFHQNTGGTHAPGWSLIRRISRGALRQAVWDRVLDPVAAWRPSRRAPRPRFYQSWRMRAGWHHIGSSSWRSSATAHLMSANLIPIDYRQSQTSKTVQGARWNTQVLLRYRSI